MDPRPSEQQIIGRVSINYVTRHFCLQISDLTSETDLAQWMITPIIEVVYGSSYWQLVQMNAEKMKQSPGDNA